MQSHIETVDPKFLDLRQFPLPLNRNLGCYDLSTSAQNKDVKAQCRDVGVVVEDVDLGVGGNQGYNRRSSSTDQLDILGPFELSKSNSNSSANSDATSNSSSNTKMYNFLSDQLIRSCLTNSVG